MSDMTPIIEPRSDQLNSDSLLAGPITIKVAQVTIRGGQEQPVAISYENDGGKPYKPCKSMSRVLVTCWGADAKQYVGRSMTLYRDPSVTWAGMAVGGIRISHLSDISEPSTMALTATKQSRKPFTVRPLVVDQGAGWKERLEAANTLAELAETWGKIPAKQQTALAGLKDSRKIALTAKDAS